jgi:phosphate/sulfate permease
VPASAYRAYSGRRPPIESPAAQAHTLTWKSLVKRALVVAMAGAAIYLALPSLIAVLGAWPRLSTLNSAWFALALVAELVSFTCNFALQRLALRTRRRADRVLAARRRRTAGAALFALPAILDGVPVSPGLRFESFRGSSG